MWQIISIVFGILVSLFNAAMFLVIRCNDLKHLEMSVKELKETIEEYGDKVSGLGERVSRMEGVCSICIKEKLEK